MSANAPQYPDSVWDTSTPSRTDDQNVDRAPDFEDWDQIVAELLATQRELDAVRLLIEANPTASIIVPGAPVYLEDDGTGLGLADETGALPVYAVLGLVRGAIPAKIEEDMEISQPEVISTGYVQKRGLLTLTTEEWDAVTGEEGGLAPDREYFLNGAGTISATPPATALAAIVSVGVAVSTTVMNVDIKFLGNVAGT